VENPITPESLLLYLRDGGAGGAGGALAPPPLRRMTFFCFVLVYGTYKEIKKGEQENESILFR
jgi:hypothetical protein